MQHTIAAMFDNRQSAEQAMAQLVNAGFSQTDLHLEDADSTDAGTVQAATPTPGMGSAASGSSGSGSGIKHFFQKMFGDDDDDDASASVYSEAVHRGNCVLTLDAPDLNEVERAADIIEGFGPIDIDEYATKLQGGGWQGETATRQGPASSGAGAMQRADLPATAATSDLGSDSGSEQRTIPVMEESLKVGKRSVQRGGVRIFQRLVETPVHESVSLREEHVEMARRPVDRPVDPADLNAFQESSFEIRESAEEAVVQKTARVVEEVVIGKSSSEREEQIHDTLRSTQVDVEQFDADGAGSQLGSGQWGSDQASGSQVGAGQISDSTVGNGSTVSGDPDNDDTFRSHWSGNYASAGGSYDDYAPAYRYGSSMAGSDLYRGRQWDDVEPDLQRNWETSYPDSTWEKFKAAVRNGWDKMTS